MACNNSEATQSLFDGALGQEAARAAEEHLKTCPECALLLRDLELIRGAIKKEVPYHRAGVSLRVRIGSAIDREAAPAKSSWFMRGARAFWLGAASGIAAAGAAAVLAFFLLMPGEADEIADAVAAAHARSLVGMHLVDVASSDPARVRSWLEAQHTVAPPVADLKAGGFELAGARSDYVYEGPAQAVVYRQAAHVVNLFAWKTSESESLPESAAAGGDNIVFWQNGSVVYCAVSDLPKDQLQRFAALVRQAG